MKDAVSKFLSQGFAPIPVPSGSKAPRISKWQDLRLTEAEIPNYFTNGANVGLILGEASSGLVDVDLDSPEAVTVAPHFLPDTAMAHGRDGSPDSHFWYRADPLPKHTQFKHPNGEMLAELRCTGQTIVPPSVHPSGEVLEWSRTGDPASVSPDDLRQAVAKIAAAALLARHWPQQGSRQDCALALAGTLLRGDFSAHDAKRFIHAVSKAANDEEVGKREAAVAETADTLRQEGEATGAPTLRKLLGDQIVDRAIEWLGFRSESTEDLLKLIEDAAQHVDPSARIFGNPDLLSRLNEAKQQRPADYALAKNSLKGKLNLNDLGKAVAAAGGRTKRRPVGECLFQKRRGYFKKQPSPNGLINVPISNFTVQVRERLCPPSGEEVLSLAIQFEDGEEVRREVPNDALLRVDGFLRRIGTTKACWYGSDRDIQLLRALLTEQDAPVRKAVEVIGCHKIDGRDFVVLPGLVLDRNGPCDNPPVRLLDLRGNPIAKQFTMDGRRRTRWPDDDEHLLAAKAIYTHFPQLNDARIIAPTIGWFFALPVANLLKRTPSWGGFPHLTPFGGSGAGKTSYIQLFLRAFGFPEDVEPFDLPGTPFTRLRALACSNLLPVFYDEYRVSALRKFERARLHGELRQAYGGGREERGRPNQDAVSYQMLTPVILAGEDRPQDLAIDNRSVVLNLRKDDRRAGPFSAVSQVPLDTFALPYLSWTLKLDDWLTDLNSCRGEVEKRLAFKGLSVDSRVVNNLSILRFGYRLFERYGDHLGLSASALVDGDLDDALDEVLYAVMPTGKERDSLDSLMELLWVMVGNGRFRLGSHYAFTRDQVVIPLREAVAEARRYARETDYEGSVLNEESYRSLVKEAAARRDSYVIDVSERADFKDGDSDRKQRRGVLIDPAILEQQLDLNAGQWGGATAHTNDPLAEFFSVTSDGA